MALSIDKKRCPQNHACPIIRICPVGAISQNGYGLPVIDNEKCTECGKCARYCGMHAVYKAS
ncbi:MAG: 4Fe-4S binding protein [Bacteroidota bacterium]|nr:4Fe-4S binding protein [Bacteroidota bacterium]